MTNYNMGWYLFSFSIFIVEYTYKSENELLNIVLHLLYFSYITHLISSIFSLWNIIALGHKTGVKFKNSNYSMCQWKEIKPTN